MNSQKEINQLWPDDRVKDYLDKQSPEEKIEWTVLDGTLYGFIDSDGIQFACADDDENRVTGIIRFLIKHGGSYISNG